RSRGSRRKKPPAAELTGIASWDKKLNLFGVGSHRGSRGLAVGLGDFHRLVGISLAAGRAAFFVAFRAVTIAAHDIFQSERHVTQFAVALGTTRARDLERCVSN